MPAREAWFLIALLAGSVSLVAGLGITRMNWRGDVEPFGLGSPVLHILAHPDRYAWPRVVPALRVLNAAGAIAFGVGAATLAMEVVCLSR